MFTFFWSGTVLRIRNHMDPHQFARLGLALKAHLDLYFKVQIRRNTPYMILMKGNCFPSFEAGKAGVFEFIFLAKAFFTLPFYFCVLRP
jgi:hypothetical protein